MTWTSYKLKFSGAQRINLDDLFGRPIWVCFPGGYPFYCGLKGKTTFVGGPANKEHTYVGHPYEQQCSLFHQVDFRGRHCLQVTKESPGSATMNPDSQTKSNPRAKNASPYIYIYIQGLQNIPGKWIPFQGIPPPPIFRLPL